MLLALTLAVAVPTGDMVAAPTRDAEIIVTAQRFARWRGVAQSRKANWTCRTRTSSGNREIDAASCQILIACVAQERARLSAADGIAEAKAKPSEQSLDAIGKCLKTRRDVAVAAYVARQRR